MPYVRHDCPVDPELHGYPVDPELLAYARRSLDWYLTKGMKVATPPAIPHVAAAWIVRNCVSSVKEDE